MILSIFSACWEGGQFPRTIAGVGDGPPVTFVLNMCKAFKVNEACFAVLLPYPTDMLDMGHVCHTGKWAGGGGVAHTST